MIRFCPTDAFVALCSARRAGRGSQVDQYPPWFRLGTCLESRLSGARGSAYQWQLVSAALTLGRMVFANDDFPQFAAAR